MRNTINTIRYILRSSAFALLVAMGFMVLQPALASAQTISDSSMNWSGYVATGNNFTGVSGTWVIPSVANTSQLSADATWVGIGGVNGSDLIQAGTQEITGQGSSTQYQAWIETLPNASTPISLTVKPGDSVSVSIIQVSSGVWQTTIRDNTSGQSFQTSTIYSSSLSSAEWIEEAPMSGNSLVPLDNFGTVQFSGATAIENGSTVNLSQAGATQMNMLNSYGQALATPSAIGSDNSSFTITKSATVSNIPSSTTRTFTPGGRHGVQGFGRRSGQSTTTTVPTTTSVTQPQTQTTRSQFPFGFFGFGNGQSTTNRNQQQNQTTPTVTTTPTNSGWTKVYTIQVGGGYYTVYMR